jgi:hypothetical protein
MKFVTRSSAYHHQRILHGIVFLTAMESYMILKYSAVQEGVEAFSVLS